MSASAVETPGETAARILNARTFYEAVGVDPSADAAAIKRAVNKHLKVVHPDKMGGVVNKAIAARAAAATQRLGQIKIVLLHYRVAYDASGRPATFDVQSSPKRRRTDADADADAHTGKCNDNNDDDDDDDDDGDAVADYDNDDVRPERVVIEGRLQDFYLGHTRVIHYTRGVLGDDGTWNNREMPFEISMPPRTPNGLFAIRKRGGRYVPGFGPIDVHFVARIQASPYCNIINKIDIQCTGYIDPIQAITGAGAEYTVAWPDGSTQTRSITAAVLHGDVVRIKGHGFRKIIEGSAVVLFGDVLVTMDCEKVLRPKSVASPPYLTKQQALALRAFGAALVSTDRDERLRAIGAAQTL